MTRLFRLARKAIKPVCLWINACCYQESEHEVSRLNIALQDQYDRQVRLQERRRDIAGW